MKILFVSIRRSRASTWLTPRSRRLTLAVGCIKARHPLAYADAIAVATARLEQAPIITGDPEILSLTRGIVKVRRLER